VASIELEPDLSNCIQTLAEREYQRALRELLASEGAAPALGERVTLLRRFLESADFGRLRSRYEPHLIQGERVRFTLSRSGDAAACRMEALPPGGSWAGLGSFRITLPRG
jgi:hypothetical protein